MDNSDDGTSVFFTTAESLVSRDTDGGYPDVYVARVGGGFADPPAPPAPCGGDGCQGAPSSPPLFPPPASTLVAPSAERDEPPLATPRLRIARPNARALRRFAASGRIALRVTATRAGRVTAVAHGTVGTRRLTVARAARALSRAGSVTLDLRLSRAARRQLGARGALRTQVTVRMTGAADQRITLRLAAPSRTSNARGR